MAFEFIPVELSAYLIRNPTAILVTLSKDGSPSASALWYVYLDGNLYFNTGRNSYKVKSILRDPRTCCLVESGVLYRDLKGVEMRGTCSLVEDPALLKRVRDALGQKYAVSRESAAQLPRRQGSGGGGGAERAVVQFVPRKVRSWDYSKMYQ